MIITELRVNHVTEPKGYCYEPVSFSWKVEEEKEAKKQNYARITVKKGEEIVFDSGDDKDADSLDYPVRFHMESRCRYDWTVCVTADNGETAEASSFFETGKLQEAWKAQWITPGEEITETDAMAGYILEKEFQVPEKTEDARLYICGLGVYECYLNGKKVGDEYLAPGYHSYDFHLQTNVYDVSAYLNPGKNQIQIWLGEGWFKSRLGFDGGVKNLYGDKLYAIAELYTDGKLIVATGADWSGKVSPVVFSGIYDGEIYDARLEDAPKTCAAVCAVPDKCGELTERYSLPIVKKESFIPIEVIISPKKETILDFGQNLTGWVEFDCVLPKGEQIRLTACEILQDGCFYHENFRLAKTEFIYISNGKKAHVRPHFTFYGFRYMLAEKREEENGAWRALEPACEAYQFTAHHLRSDFDQIGQDVTGSAKVNQLFSNALWGQKDNFLDVPTDCPQRDERLGWTGDAQVFSETACYNMYMPAFYRKYLWDMRAEQSMIGGAVPNIVPRIKEGMIAEYGSCPWADAGVIIPWNVYLHYGSKTLLAETYPGMKAWVDYQRRLEETTTIWERWNSVMPDGHMIPEGMNSLNHYSYGSIEAWMYGYTAGIRALEPGFRRAVIEPHPDERLGFVECTIKTAAGTYQSNWRYEEDGNVSYEIVVPFGCTGELRLPDGRQFSAVSGTYVYSAGA